MNIAPYANLRGADLRGLCLVGVDLRGAHLVNANLMNVELSGATLVGANLQGADLRSADLRSANLRSANFLDARVNSFTKWSLSALSALWMRSCGPLSCLPEAMRFDASFHPDPAAFDRWAAGGPCPYWGPGAPEQAVGIYPVRELWAPGPPPRAWDLLMALVAECCRMEE